MAKTKVRAVAWSTELVNAVLAGRAKALAGRYFDCLLRWLSQSQEPDARAVATEFKKQGVERNEAEELVLAFLDNLLFRAGNKDPYRVLGLKPGAEAKEVRNRYQRLIQIYHPDRARGDAQWLNDRTERLNRAYKRLKQSDSGAAIPGTWRPHPSTPPPKAPPETPAPRYYSDGGTELRKRMGTARQFRQRFFVGLVLVAALILTVVYMKNAPTAPAPVKSSDRENPDVVGGTELAVGGSQARNADTLAQRDSASGGSKPGTDEPARLDDSLVPQGRPPGAPGKKKAISKEAIITVPDVFGGEEEKRFAEGAQTSLVLKADSEAAAKKQVLQREETEPLAKKREPRPRAATVGRRETQAAKDASGSGIKGKKSVASIEQVASYMENPKRPVDAKANRRKKPKAVVKKIAPPESDKQPASGKVASIRKPARGVPRPLTEKLERGIRQLLTRYAVAIREGDLRGLGETLAARVREQEEALPRAELLRKRVAQFKGTVARDYDLDILTIRTTVTEKVSVDGEYQAHYVYKTGKVETVSGNITFRVSELGGRLAIVGISRRQEHSKTSAAASEIKAVLSKYSDSYRAGDIERFMGLFGTNPVENKRVGYHVIRENYAKLFGTTESRQLTFEIDRIYPVRASRFLVEARYRVDLHFHDGKKFEKENPIRIWVEVGNHGFRISRIEY